MIRNVLLASVVAMSGVSASADDFCQAMSKYIADDYHEADCLQEENIYRISTKNDNYIPNQYGILFSDINEIFGDNEYVHSNKELEAGVQYSSDFVNEPVIEGKVAIVERWRTDDYRDNGQNEIGIRATDTNHDIEPYIGTSRTIRRPEYDYSAKAGVDPDGFSIGFMGMHDVEETEESGVAIGVAARIDNGAVQVGPALELTGEKYGLAIFPTDLAIVERGGDNMMYRKRYSLNPIAIIIGEINGQRTALDVLGEMNNETNNTSTAN